MSTVFYLINLDDSTERLKSATEQLSREDVDFIRISAFDGRGKSMSDFKDYDEAKAESYMGRGLRGGEMGCYYSHLECIRQFLATAHDYAVVIEDDVFIPNKAMQTLKKMMSWLQGKNLKWDVINFGAQKNKIYSTLTEIDTHKLVKAHYFPMTTTGIVWTRSGAQRFLEYSQTIYAPVDNALREWQCQENLGVSIVPPLVSTTGAESDIDSGTIKARSKQGRLISYGLRKQWRLWRQKSLAIIHKIFKKV